MSIKTVLVTGSSGTVGTALCQELIARGYGVIGLDIRHSLWDRQIDRKTVFHDLRRPLGRSLPGRRRRPDLIIHLAANARVHDSVINPQLAHDNYLMTYNVLEYARKSGVKRILFSSSREVYGQSAAGRSRRESSTDITRIESPYTASKFAGEALFGAYQVCYDIQPVIVRLSNVYGRYDVSERVIPVFMYHTLRNRPLTVFGRKSLDFTFTDDCTDGLVRIVERFDKVSGLTFNISRGRSGTLLQVAQIIKKKLGSSSELTLGQRRTGEISSFVGDISLAKRKLGYRPEVDLEEGIEKNIEWYLKAMKDRRVYLTQRRILAKRGWA